MSLFSKQRRRAHDAYVQLVRLARAPELYTRCGIPDTLDGRFDAIVLHVFLFQRRLREQSSPRTARLGRMVSEAFIADMDRSLREMGVGDTGVAVRVKKMASALLGRMQAYDATWGDGPAFRDALIRNLYRGDTTGDADALATYLEKTYREEIQATSSWLLGEENSAPVAA